MTYRSTGAAVATPEAQANSAYYFSRVEARHPAVAIQLPYTSI